MTRIEKILAKVEIAEYIGGFVKLRKKSGVYQSRCPFHAEKHASFTVFPKHQNFYCFGCGEHGSVIDFVKLYSKTDVRGALDILEGTAPNFERPILIKKELPPQPIPKKAEERYNSLFQTAWPKGERPPEGISNAAWIALGASWNKDHWILPMRDAACEIIGLQRRYRDGKKITVRGTRLGLFVPRIPIRGTLSICEGASDTGCLLTLGFTAIGRPAALVGIDMAIEFAHAHNIENVLIFSDTNEVGIEGSKRLSERIGIENRIIIPPHKDVRESLQKIGAEKLREFFNTPIKLEDTK